MQIEIVSSAALRPNDMTFTVPLHADAATTTMVLTPIPMVYFSVNLTAEPKNLSNKILPGVSDLFFFIFSHHEANELWNQ